MRAIRRRAGDGWPRCRRRRPPGAREWVARLMGTSSSRNSSLAAWREPPGSPGAGNGQALDPGTMPPSTRQVPGGHADVVRAAARSPPRVVVVGEGSPMPMKTTLGEPARLGRPTGDITARDLAVLSWRVKPAWPVGDWQFIAQRPGSRRRRDPVAYAISTSRSGRTGQGEQHLIVAPSSAVRRCASSSWAPSSSSSRSRNASAGSSSPLGARRADRGPPDLAARNPAHVEELGQAWRSSHRSGMRHATRWARQRPRPRLSGRPSASPTPPASAVAASG